MWEQYKEDRFMVLQKCNQHTLYKKNEQFVLLQNSILGYCHCIKYETTVLQNPGQCAITVYTKKTYFEFYYCKSIIKINLYTKSTKSNKHHFLLLISM